MVWWIGGRLIEERERVCDEEVLQAGSDPQVYAEAILNVCKMYVQSPLRCVSGVGGSGIKYRIQSILNVALGANLTTIKKVSLALAGTAAVAVPIAVGFINAPVIRAQSQSRPKFEVASIRPCKPGELGGGGQRGLAVVAHEECHRDV